MKPCPGPENEWHPHPNGGGWVKNTATVPRTIFVGPDAVIWGGTFRGGTFRGGTFWGGTFRGGTFRGGTFWGGTFEGGTFWGGTFEGGTFEGGTFWGGTFEGGTFWGGIVVGGIVVGGTWDRQPLTVYGSRHPVTNAKPGHIKIGCRCEPFEWWTTPEAEKFAIDSGYTESEREEYRHYVDLIRKLGV